MECIARIAKQLLRYSSERYQSWKGKILARTADIRYKQQCCLRCRCRCRCRYRYRRERFASCVCKLFGSCSHCELHAAVCMECCDACNATGVANTSNARQIKQQALLRMYVVAAVVLLCCWQLRANIWWYQPSAYNLLGIAPYGQICDMSPTSKSMLF